MCIPHSPVCTQLKSRKPRPHVEVPADLMVSVGGEDDTNPDPTHNMTPHLAPKGTLALELIR